MPEPTFRYCFEAAIWRYSAGKKLLWVCGDRGFHCAAGVFGGDLKCSGRLSVIPVEAVLDSTRRSPHGGAELSQPASREKRLWRNDKQRRKLRPPDAGGFGET